jgi:hypothetical protein
MLAGGQVNLNIEVKQMPDQLENTFIPGNCQRLLA